MGEDVPGTGWQTARLTNTQTTMKTYEHTTTGIRVEATDIDHACELIELEQGVSDAGRSTGAREQVDREDVEEVL